jgi:hypothetical protein
VKDTYRPSALIDGFVLSPSAALPSAVVLIRRVLSVTVS